MAKRTDLPQIVSTERTGLINRGFGQGMFWGQVGLTAAAAAFPAILATSVVAQAGLMAAGTFAPALVGGLNVKAKENSPKTVSDPTLLNGGIVSGAGYALGFGALAVTGASLLGAAAAVPIISVGALIATPVLMTVGAFDRKSKMQDDLGQAVTQAQQQQLALSHGRGRGRGQSQAFEMAQNVEQSADRVTAEDMALIQAKLEARAAERGGHGAAARESQMAAELQETAR